MSYAASDAAPTAAAERPGDAYSHLSKSLPIVRKEATMLHYAVVFFVIALIAALFGFTGIAVGAASIAKILFMVFLLFAVVTFVLSVVRKV
jgi:uncharacterized membrane protein YtjA (UPF0391 family)